MILFSALGSIALSKSGAAVAVSFGLRANRKILFNLSIIGGAVHLTNKTFDEAKLHLCLHKWENLTP